MKLVRMNIHSFLIKTPPVFLLLTKKWIRHCRGPHRFLKPNLIPHEKLVGFTKIQWYAYVLFPNLGCHPCLRGGRFPQN